MYDGEHPFRLRTPRTTSFPSGHASSGFMAATLLADGGRAPGRWAWYGLAAVVASSRIHTRSHHASDVVAGAALGLVLGLMLGFQAVMAGEPKVAFAAGGVSQEERNAMQGLQGKFNTQFTFAVAQTGHYVADVEVAITDRSGNEMLTTVVPGPVPRTRARSMPSLRASIRTDGAAGGSRPGERAGPLVAVGEPGA